jgi:hypothetical protein
MKLIIFFLFNVVIVTCAPFLILDGFRQLSPTESSKLGEIIAQGDNPEDIVNFLHDNQLENGFACSFATNDHLRQMVLGNRIASLKILLPLVKFPEDGYTGDLNGLLMLAVWECHPEICDFLMSQPFRHYWQPIPFWNYQSYKWATQELIDLVSRHPIFRKNFAALGETMATCSSVGVGLAMIEFNHHFATKDIHFASIEGFQPASLMNGLLRNERLNDEDMTTIASRLFELGVDVDYETCTAFIQSHPEHQRTYQRLFLNSFPDVKTPNIP